MDSAQHHPFPRECSSDFATATATAMFPNFAGAQDVPETPLFLRGSLQETTFDADETPRARFSREQILLLERQFAESPKPNTRVRRALAESTGLSVQRVGNWFQTRRAKAKQQKRLEELHTRQILESAGRRRVTEPSSPASLFPSPPQTSYGDDDSNNMHATPTKLRRVKSAIELPQTPLHAPQDSANSSSYSSPSEACYASLARSLAIAAAAAAQANSVGGFQEHSHELPQPAWTIADNRPAHLGGTGLEGTTSPWPVSAFSDWGGSSRSSVAAYTPTPAGQLEDPFEYDHLMNSNRMQDGPSENSYFSYQPPAEDFAAFAQGIEMNTNLYTFNLPSFPPRLPRERRRQQNSATPEPQSQPTSHPRFPFTTEAAAESAEPDLSLGKPDETNQTDAHASLAMRRRCSKPTPLGPSSLSSRSTFPLGLQDAGPATPLRRIKSISAGDCGKISKALAPSSPLRQVEKYDDTFWDDFSMATTSTTIRPRTASSATTSQRRLSQLFAPPTPVSPDSEDPQESNSKSATPSRTNSDLAAMLDTEATQSAIDSQISPPPTPQDSLNTSEQSTHDPNYNRTFPPKIIDFSFDGFDYDEGDDASSIPRDFYDESGFMEIFSFPMPSGSGGGDTSSSSSSGGGMFSKEEAFPFDRYSTTGGVF